MPMSRLKVLVLKAPGTNCDQEMAWGLELAGAQPQVRYFFELQKTPKLLENYGMLVLPGGFSYGDYLGSGKIFASLLESDFMQALWDFLDKGGLILGVCNGFQILLHLGLLPGGEKYYRASLTANATGRFECRWLRLQFNTESRLWRKHAFFGQIFSEYIELPIAHGEGRFELSSESALRVLEEWRLPFLRYVDNVNGSMGGIAGITNANGNVIGLMPHPERFLIKEHYYDWPGKRDLRPWGLEFLKAVIRMA